tara:strand:- start:114 stop:290 length:177 start_codon:yes stop_codon:yes gene_type:complete
MSSYKGLYVQRLDDGTIDSVQVEDTAGISMPFDPDEYVRRGIKPDISCLPDIDDYEKA